MSTPRALLVSILVLSCHPGLAHHSRANFQLDNLVEMRGTVTEFNWANPHIYWRMDIENGENWLIEGHSIPGVVRLGWARDSIQVGDELLIAAFPDQNTDRNFALVEYLVLADGTPLAGFTPNAIPAELRAGAGSGAGAGGGTGAGAPPGPGRGGGAAEVAPSTDFSGNWRNDLRGVNLRTGAFFDPQADMPLTAAGEAVMAAYDETENPSYQCEQGGLPIGGGPYGIRIDRHEDRLAIMGEHTNVGEENAIWLNASAAPQDQPPSRQGLAIGRAEDDRTIVFEVTNYVATKWGLGRGLDSSDQKNVSGRLELQADGLAINYSYEITDPVYLTEPLTSNGVLRKEPDREFVNEPCDPEISSMHLTVD